MANTSFHFWTKWLLWANIFTIFIGLLVAFAGNSVVFALHNEKTYTLFFQSQPLEGDLLRFKNWLFGIIGGTIVGFHILAVFIIKYAFTNKEIGSWYALWSGLLSWFFIDSIISLYYGAYYNLFMINLFALFLIGLPLIMTKSHFRI